MSAVAAIVALPVAALTIWALLRNGLGGRLVATPSGDRWHEHETPLFGGVGIFLGLLAGIGACLLAGAIESPERRPCSRAWAARPPCSHSA